MMTDDEYNLKIKEIAKYAQFVEKMITQIKNPNLAKDRETQLSNIRALHCMITDNTKKLKLDTLKNCEKILFKLYKDFGYHRKKSTISQELNNIDKRQDTSKSYDSTSKEEDYLELQPSSSGKKNKSVIYNSIYNEYLTTNGRIRLEHDINYFFKKNETATCKLCLQDNRFMVRHYKQKHASEVLISRLSPEITAEAVKESQKKNYESIIPIDLVDSKKRKRKFNFKCIFCGFELKNEFTVLFFDHLTTHTGEYRYTCKVCVFFSNKISVVRKHCQTFHYWTLEELKEIRAIYNSPPNMNLVFGYVCGKCNYLQLNNSHVEKHIKSFHSGDDIKIYKINMSVEPTDKEIVEENQMQPVIQEITNDINIETSETKLNLEEYDDQVVVKDLIAETVNINEEEHNFPFQISSVSTLNDKQEHEFEKSATAVNEVTNKSLERANYFNMTPLSQKILPREHVPKRTAIKTATSLPTSSPNSLGDLDEGVTAVTVIKKTSKPLPTSTPIISTTNAAISATSEIIATTTSLVPEKSQIGSCELIEIKEDVIEIKEDVIEIKEDAIEIKEDVIEIKEDAIEIKEDVIEITSSTEPLKTSTVHPNVAEAAKIDVTSAKSKKENCNELLKEFEDLMRKGVDLENYKTHEVHEIAQMDIETLMSSDLMGAYGSFGKPLNKNYLCPLCFKFKTKNPKEMTHHLYRELDYYRFICKVCGRKAITSNFLERHAVSVHKSNSTTSLILSLSPNIQIENWVQVLLLVQSRIVTYSKTPKSVPSKTVTTITPSVKVQMTPPQQVLGDITISHRKRKFLETVNSEITTAAQQPSSLSDKRETCLNSKDDDIFGAIKTYQCKYCTKEESQLVELRSHWESEHKDKKTFLYSTILWGKKCKVDNKLTPPNKISIKESAEENPLSVKNLLTVSSKKYICVICCNYFKSERNLQKHCATVHKRQAAEPAFPAKERPWEVTQPEVKMKPTARKSTTTCSQLPKMTARKSTTTRKIQRSRK